MQRFDCLAADAPLLGPHFLEASAGTGKTFAVEHIVARLLMSGMGLEQILVVTFTRAAARELKLRIRSNLERKSLAADFERCQIYTIHGFCFRMLKEFAYEMGLPLSLKEGFSSDRKEAALRDFFEMKLTKEIVSPEQLEVFLRTSSIEELARKLKKEEMPESFKNYAELNREFQALLKPVELEKLREDFASLRDSYKKKEGNFEVQLKALAEGQFGPLIREKGSLFAFLAQQNRKVKYKEPAFLHYPGFFDPFFPLIQSAINETFPAILAAWKPIERKILDEEGNFGPDELLKTMHEAVKKEPFRQKIQKKYRAVLIDEFQDTDPIQWDIFQTLFLSTAEALYLIGDPKQSIYRFRKADLYTYLKAKEAIPQEGHFYLDTNFRSSKQLIGALNRLFDREWLHLPKLKRTMPYLPVRAGLDLASEFPDGKGAVHCVLFENEEMYSYVAREINRLKPETASLSSFAVLVKDRYQAAEMQKMLDSLGIANIARAQEPLAKSLAFEAVEELFKALHDPRNLGKAKAVMAGPFGGLSAEEIGKMEHSPFLDLREILEEKGLAEMCRELKRVSFECGQVLELVFEWERNNGFSFEGLRRFFDRLRTMDPDDADYLYKDVDLEAVQIMTIHVSKGLEFDIVFALGLERRTPASDEEEDAEKLRQLYVAMTRAKRRLYVPIPLRATPEGKLSSIELFCRALGPWEEELNKIAAETSLTIERVDAPIVLPPKMESAKSQIAAPEPKPPPFEPSFLLSFTALARESAPRVLEAMEDPKGVYTIQNMPRGAETGILIHKIFERLFSGLPFDDLITGPWKEAIYKMIDDTLDLPLPTGFCLREIDRRSSRVEAEFLFQTKPNYLKGFIDLVFIHKEKLYFVDWKTNWLSDYSEGSLQAAMEEHQYSLQASIYSEALRRSWNGQIGGAIYIFIRGPKAIWKN